MKAVTLVWAWVFISALARRSLDLRARLLLPPCYDVSLIYDLQLTPWSGRSIPLSVVSNRCQWLSRQTAGLCKEKNLVDIIVTGIIDRLTEFVGGQGE